MNGSDGEWAALVASRLCHDLVSPLGAIGNGLELLRMTQAASPELDLMANATTSALARLRLFRLGFGAALDGQDVAAATMTEALSALGERIELRTELPSSLPRAQARRLVLAALCAESALAWGGVLTVWTNGVRAAAERMKLDARLWQALAAGQPPAASVAATVHFALLSASGPVTVETGDTTLSISL